MGRFISVVLIIFGLSGLSLTPTGVRFTGVGTVTFKSVAPLETINATNSNLKGIIDFSEMTFAFSVPVNLFQGFNSPLQKEHFNEYYLETEKYPKAVFAGKLIGADACTSDCKMTIQARGKMTIHGKTQVVTIPIDVVRNGTSFQAQAAFEVPIKNYGISTPKILESKIASIIQIEVDLELNSE